MKKMILLLLTLILLFSAFISCNSKRYLVIDDETSSSPDENTTAEAFDTSETTETDEIHETDAGIDDDIVDTVYPTAYNYTLTKKGDQWYMVFDTYVHRPMQGGVSALSFDIDSAHIFKHNIVNDDLEYWQKELIVARFPRDNIGVLIPDIDNILNPILPQGVSVYQMTWTGDTYTFSFNDENDTLNGIGGYVRQINEELFVNQYNNADEDNTYISENKTIVMRYVKNDFEEVTYLYVKQASNYACFVVESGLTPENMNQGLIMSFGFEVCE